jgi:hypothetical protein
MRGATVYFVALVLSLFLFTTGAARAQDPAPAENPPAETAAPAPTAAQPAQPAEQGSAASTAEPGAAHAPPAASAEGEGAVPKPSDEGDISAADEKLADDAAATHDSVKYAEVLRSILPHVREAVRTKRR